MSDFRLTQKQHEFMDLFGYLQFPGLLSDRIDAIIEEFEAVFASHGGGHDGHMHDGTARSCLVPFIDQSELLSSLLDDSRIDGILISLSGRGLQLPGQRRQLLRRRHALALGYRLERQEAGQAAAPLLQDRPLSRPGNRRLGRAALDPGQP